MHEQDDTSSLAYASLQPEQIIATLEQLDYRCDGRFLALNSYENRVYQVSVCTAGGMGVAAVMEAA